MRAKRKIQVLALLCACYMCMFQPIYAYAAEDMQNGAGELLKELEPKLIVESYQVIDGQAAQGEVFTLQINVRNTNAYADAFNVITTYNSESDNVRLVDEIANQKYDEMIPAGKTVTYEYQCEVLDAYTMDTIIMNFMFSYEDKYGRSYENASMITPSIHKSCELSINSLSVAENAAVGAKALVNVRYSSTGTLAIKDVVMIIDGNILGGRKEVELAQLTNDEQRSMDYYVNFSEAGAQLLTISFRYTDENGKEYEVDKQEFVVDVSNYHATVTKEDSTSVSELLNEENKPYVIIGGVSLGVALVLIIVIIALKCSIRKQKKGRR